MRTTSIAFSRRLWAFSMLSARIYHNLTVKNQVFGTERGNRCHDPWIVASEFFLVSRDEAHTRTGSSQRGAR